MSDSRSRWSELLGISDDIRDPDLYQILGFERLAFDAPRLEERFRERMQKIQAVRSTKHKEFLEFVKGELRRARRILADERERASYDRDLVNERAQRLRRVLSAVLATGSLPPSAERAVEDEARRLGLADQEARATIDEELVRTGARRGVAARMLTDVAGLPPGEAAAVAAAEAAELAKLAAAAAARALEAAHQAEAARARASATARLRAAPTDPGPPADEETAPLPSASVESSEETSERARRGRKKKRGKRGQKTAAVAPVPAATPPRPKTVVLPMPSPVPSSPVTPEPSPEPSAATPPAAPARTGALKKSDALAALQFCDRCGVSLPSRWTKTGEAERVGIRLLCAACSAPIRAGTACAGCSRPTTEGDRPVSPLATIRMCAHCAGSTRRLKVCAGCQMVLPRAAIERGEARSRGGQLYCAECLASDVV